MVLIFEPTPGAEPGVEALLRAARQRAEAAGWHCWAYRNELRPLEITLFVEGPRDDAAAGTPAAIFGTEIADLKALARRFEPVRSLVEYPLEGVRP
jgi:hypothetical protein